MRDRLDEIDKHILYHLVQDARNTSSSSIAEEVNVSSVTIRNRSRQMEEAGILRGYHAAIDYERAEGRLTNIYICTCDTPNRNKLAKQVAEIPGVVSVRELMTGRNNLHVMAVGEDMDELSRVSTSIANLGIEIEEENLLRSEQTLPHDKFGPHGEPTQHSITDVMQLSGDAEVVELTVSEQTEIAGLSLSEANNRGLLDPDVLVVSIKREDTMLTPKGDTEILPGDLVTVFSRHGLDEQSLSPFNQTECRPSSHTDFSITPAPI